MAVTEVSARVSPTTTSVVEVGEAAADLGDAEVADGEADGRVGRVEGPAAGDQGEVGGDVGADMRPIDAPGAARQEGRIDPGTDGDQADPRIVPAHWCGVTEHIDLGGFLRARREALQPADVGLRDSGRRRTPGLRREEVAALAGVSIDYLVRLEQGRDTKPSAAVLSALSDALRLTEEEHSHLAMLATISASPEMCPAASRPAERRVPATVRDILTALAPTPAFVQAPWGDVLAANEPWQALVAPLGLLETDQANLARFTFGDPRAAPPTPTGRPSPRTRSTSSGPPTSAGDATR